MANRPHILFVITGISAGTGTFCKSLGRGLREQFGDELKVSLLTFRNDATLPENSANFDSVFTLSSTVQADWRRAFNLPLAALRLRAAVREIKPDLIFTIGTFSNVVASLAIENIPVVLSDHLNMTQRLRNAPLGSVTKWFMRRAYPNRLMVAASRELAEDLSNNFNATRTAVIPNGIDASIINARADETVSISIPERYFISVGRLTEQKDVATTLRAFAAAKNIAEHLVIAGDGEQRVMLESLARELNVAERVHFLGHCSNPYPLIKRARALILSSIWEGFAYVPIEAMALAVPVIATACPSGPVEILGGGEFGMLVPPRDPSALANAMHQISTDEVLHAKFVTQSKIRAEQLSIENMASAYRKVFLDELKSARRI